MSIAVSAVIRPSRLLLAAVAAMTGLACAIGIGVLSGSIGELSLMWRLLTGFTVLFLAFFGFYHGVGIRKILQLDIAATGLIHLSVFEEKAPCSELDWPHVGTGRQVVQLMAGSTIWPCLLLLRLRTEDRSIRVVPILPDSVSRESFRALSVAFRWMARQSDSRESSSF
jgi:toxin CptA